MPRKTLAALSIAAVATAIACSGPSGATGNSAAALRTTGFVLLPLARNCPATIPVNMGGPGEPATYTLGYEVTIQNETPEPVAIESVAMLGSVVAATNNVGVSRPAHVFASIPFAPNTVIAADDELEITGFLTVLCGDNPIITQPTFWDIATVLNIVTDGGGVGTVPVTFRRNWSACDAGHPCPLTQPPLPNN